MNAEVPFDAPSVTLAQAMARAGGLNDERADAASVLVFRFESADLLPVLFPDRSQEQMGSRAPVIYRLNLREPLGLFLAQSFYMREGDAIYVSDAPGAELGKFLRIVGGGLAPAVSGATLYNVAK